jgi:hypothetical protein
MGGVYLTPHTLGVCLMRVLSTRRQGKRLGKRERLALRQLKIALGARKAGSLERDKDVILTKGRLPNAWEQQMSHPRGKPMVQWQWNVANARRINAH